MGGLDRVHHDHSLDGSLSLNREELLQLVFCGDKDDSHSGIPQQVSGLFAR